VFNLTWKRICGACIYLKEGIVSNVGGSLAGLTNCRLALLAYFFAHGAWYVLQWTSCTSSVEDSVLQIGRMC